MSEFLMVVPAGWEEVPNAGELVEASGGEAAVLDALSQGMGNVDTLIEPAGLPLPGMRVEDARLFKDGDHQRLWVKFAPIPDYEG